MQEPKICCSTTGSVGLLFILANYIPHRYILQQSVWVQMRQERTWSLREGINPTAKPTGTGCVDCLATGGWWLHLRRCAECGRIGCCDTRQASMPQNTTRTPAIPLSLASSTGRIGSTITVHKISLPGPNYQAPMPIPWTNPCLDRLDRCPRNGNRSCTNRVQVGIS
jgi:hypothetical protein